MSLVACYASTKYLLFFLTFFSEGGRLRGWRTVGRGRPALCGQAKTARFGATYSIGSRFYNLTPSRSGFTGQAITPLVVCLICACKAHPRTVIAVGTTPTAHQEELHPLGIWKIHCPLTAYKPLIRRRVLLTWPIALYSFSTYHFIFTWSDKLHYEIVFRGTIERRKLKRDFAPGKT